MSAFATWRRLLACSSLSGCAVLLGACLSLLGCAGPPEAAGADRLDWVELLSEGTAEAPAGRAAAPPAEAFTAERLPVRGQPTALELLEAHRYRTAAQLAAPSGEWPDLNLAPGVALPDPRYPLRFLLGQEFEPRYVIVREANALILRTERGSRVVPLDPERPVRFPEDGSREQERARRNYRGDLDRDLRGLQPPERIAP